MSRRLQYPSLLGILLLAVTTLTGVATAQAGVGAPYSARNPRPCTTTQATPTRPPDVATATRAFTCKAEGVFSGSLFLVDNVRLQVGGGTPYRDLPQIHRPGNADPSATIYAIRGSYSKYLCERVGTAQQLQLGIGSKPGANCRRYDYPQAEGTCFRDNFGEWDCHLIGEAEPKYGTSDQPAPRN